jgi:hypothetical protein
MTITQDVITDLLPVYYSEECSKDTKTLVEEYFHKHPDFQQRAQKIVQDPFPNSTSRHLNKNDELITLKKTRKLLRLRSSVMALAIFFSCAVFSFVYEQGQFRWIILNSFPATLFYGIPAVISWIAYFLIKRRTGDL